MSSRPPTGIELELALRAKLKEILDGVDCFTSCTVKAASAPSAHKAFDLLASLQHSRLGLIELCIECKGELRPSQIPAIAAALRAASRLDVGQRVPMLATVYVTSQVAEACAREGLNWYDLAGNCRIKMDDSIYLHISGNESQYRRREPGKTLGSAESSRVIRALLATENLGMNWTLRELSQRCGPPVSLGTSQKTVRILKDEKLVEDTDKEFRVRDPFDLLNFWSSAYRFDRHGHRHYQFAGPAVGLRELLAPLECVTGGHVAYALFSAADQTKTARTCIYLDPAYLPEVEGLPGITPAGGDGNLTVILPEDPGVFYGQEATIGSRLPSTSLVQTYVDLGHAGPPGRKAAATLLEQKIKPLWGALTGHLAACRTDYDENHPKLSPLR